MAKRRKISLTIEGINNSIFPIILSFYSDKEFMPESSEMIFYINQNGDYCELPKNEPNCYAKTIAKGFQNIPGVISTESSPIYISDIGMSFSVYEGYDSVIVLSKALAIIKEIFGEPLRIKRIFEEE